MIPDLYPQSVLEVSNRNFREGFNGQHVVPALMPQCGHRHDERNK